jgi:hypothetical protein
VWSTKDEPDELLRKACGNRREAICGPCAERYRGHAWQLVAAGLRGGKGVPESVVAIRRCSRTDGAGFGRCMFILEGGTTTALNID